MREILCLSFTNETGYIVPLDTRGIQYFSLRCQSNKGNIDRCSVHYSSSHKSLWWCIHSFSSFYRQLVMLYASFCAQLLYSEIKTIWSYNDIEITCLKELISTLEIIRTHRVHDIVSMWYMADRKLCFVVHRPVKIWSCTLYCKHCNFTILCLSPNVGTILTRFAKSWYYFDVVIRKQHLKNRVIFPIIIEKYLVPQLLWWEKSHSSWRLFMLFPYQNLFWSISIQLKVVHQQLTTCYKLQSCLSLMFRYIFKTSFTFEIALFSILLLEYVRSIQKTVSKIFILVLTLNNATLLYSYKSSYLYHIK